MSSLRNFIDKKRNTGEKLLSIYLTAGFPTEAATVPLLKTIVKSGADFIELGVPFSDPLADGPTIQNASQVALQNGMTLSKTLRLLQEFTEKNSAPVLLMGYANPFLHFGWEKFLDHARQSGAGGLIIPDLPPEESEQLCQMANARGLDLIFLIAPNTPKERLTLIDRQTTAFIYAVSLTGVTGARDSLPEKSKIFLQNLRKTVSHPILTGFGISNAETARGVAPYCDGVIVGSAIIREIAKNPDPQAARDAVGKLVEQIKTALR